MGILTGGNSGEGPGVDKNERKKKGFFLYIDVVVRKFVKLMGVDLAYFIVSLPYLALAYMVLSTFVMTALGITTESMTKLYSNAAMEGLTTEELVNMMSTSIRMIITMILFNFLGSGPAGASYAYISRCYTRGEHAWLWSDGWDQFKGNLKNSIPLLVLDLVVIALGTNAIAFYSASLGSYTGAAAVLMQWAKYVMIMLLIVYMMFHMYAYQIMVTYECGFFELIKYSILITIAKLPMSILLTVVGGGIILILFGYLYPVIGLVAYPFFMMTFTRFSMEFYASRVIEKNIKAVKKKNKKKNKKKKAKVTYLDE